MAINPRPVPAPIESKMMDDNNMCTPVWAHFFNTIYRLQKKHDVMVGTEAPIAPDENDLWVDTN